ncbi:MAG: hypothetical protein RIC87_09200 [Kiloniellales bacterium]
MSTIKDIYPKRHSAPTPEDIDAHIAVAHRMRSEAMGQGLCALFRVLLKPLNRKNEQRLSKTPNAGSGATA